MSEKTEQKPLKPLQPKISLFGPTGSGKSSLLIALKDFIVSNSGEGFLKFDLTDSKNQSVTLSMKPNQVESERNGIQATQPIELDNTRSDYRIDSENQSVTLSIKPHQVESEKNGIQATQQIAFFNVEFQRNQPSSKEYKSYSSQISSFTHRFQIVDNAGEKLEDLPKETKEVILNNYRNPYGIVILLDYNQVVAFENKIEGENQFSKENYYNMIEYLVKEVVQENVYLAFCITKIDNFDDTTYDIAINNNFLLFINDYFGENMNKLIVDLQEKRPDKIKVFAISAVGRRIVGNTSVSNLNIRTNKIQDPDNWHPINLTDPFFWLLDEMERGWIKENSGGPIARLFLNDRLKAFVPLYKK